MSEIDLDQMVTKGEFDARMTPVENMVRRIDQKLDKGADRGLDILKLTVSVVVPATLALAAWTLARDEVTAAKIAVVGAGIEAENQVRARDRYWMEKHQDGMWNEVVKLRDELNDRSGRLAHLESFTETQQRSNSRQQDRLDSLDRATSVDKDALERDAFVELRERIKRLEEGIRRGFLRSSDIPIKGGE